MIGQLRQVQHAFYLESHINHTDKDRWRDSRINELFVIVDKTVVTATTMNYDTNWLKIVTKDGVWFVTERNILKSSCLLEDILIRNRT